MLRTSFCDRKCCCFVLVFCLGFLTRKLYDQTDENKVYIGNNSAFAVTILEDVLPNKPLDKSKIENTDNCVRCWLQNKHLYVQLRTKSEEIA